MNIATLGLWHLGAVTSACLASVGHRVVAFDHDGILLSRDEFLKVKFIQDSTATASSVVRFQTYN